MTQPADPSINGKHYANGHGRHSKGMWSVLDFPDLDP
jgi:hypothetical protein